MTKFKKGDSVRVDWVEEGDRFRVGEIGVVQESDSYAPDVLFDAGFLTYASEDQISLVEEDSYPLSATDFLRQAAALQESRAAEYDQAGGERSAGKIAQAFNAITGHSLTEQDVWMMLVVLKQVRFYNNPTKKHRDSVEDLVSYSALFAESVFK